MNYLFLPFIFPLLIPSAAISVETTPPRFEDRREAMICPPKEALSGNLVIHHIYVDQGDATFILFPSGKTMLVDGGEIGEHKSVLSRIAYCYGDKINTINYMINTHPHKDHFGGLIGILKAIKEGSIPLTIERIYYSGDEKTQKMELSLETEISLRTPSKSPQNSNPKESPLNLRLDRNPKKEERNLVLIFESLSRIAKLGMPFVPALGKSSFADINDANTEVNLVVRSGRVLMDNSDPSKFEFARGTTRTLDESDSIRKNAPDLVEKFKNVHFVEEYNAVSLGMTIRYGNFSYALLGDLTGGGDNTPKVEQVLATSRALGAVDVYHSNHHGSSTSNSQELLDALNPRDVVISLGADETKTNCVSFQLPNRNVIQRFEDHASIKNVYMMSKGCGERSDSQDFKVVSEKRMPLPNAQGNYRNVQVTFSKKDKFYVKFPERFQTSFPKPINVNFAKLQDVGQKVGSDLIIVSNGKHYGIVTRDLNSPISKEAPQRPQYHSLVKASP